MVYGISGSLNIAEIATFANNAELASREVLVLNFGLVFLVIGIAFKLGAVPFHMWVPDVYQGSPTSVTLFISTVPKIAAVAMLVRLLVDGLGAMQPYWSEYANRRLMLVCINATIEPMAIDKIDQPVSILLYTNRGICRMNMRNKITTCVQVINEVKKTSEKLAFIF
jgi:hypothetical protein